MATIVTPVAWNSATPPDMVWRLSVAQYHAMMRAAILTEDDPVELLEGWLISKMPKNPPHSTATRLLRAALTRLITTGWSVDSQEPLTTADSEPEPDVYVVRGTANDYRERHPGPADVALVAEVSDATLQRDRTLKQRVYARAGIAVYWIVNLVERRIEVYSGLGPAAERYAERRDFGEAEQVPVVIGGVVLGTVLVADVLP